LLLTCFCHVFAAVLSCCSFSFKLYKLHVFHTFTFGPVSRRYFGMLAENWRFGK
jgi:hypothetical protein